MARLIETDASKRLSAKETLQHPWSQHEDDGCHNLCYYVGSIQFRSAISRLFRAKYADHSITTKHFKNLKALCDELDVDGGGMIDFVTFKEALVESKDFKISEFDVDIDEDQVHMRIKTFRNSQIYPKRAYHDYHVIDFDFSSNVK